MAVMGTPLQVIDVIGLPFSTEVNTNNNWPGPPGLLKVWFTTWLPVQPPAICPLACTLGVPHEVGQGVGVMVNVGVGVKVYWGNVTVAAKYNVSFALDCPAPPELDNTGTAAPVMGLVIA
jgi:hypothetical protein